MTDPSPSVPYRDAVRAALDSAVRLGHGDPTGAASDQLQAALRDLHAQAAPLDYMADWAGQVRARLGIPDGARAHVITRNLSTGEAGPGEEMPVDLWIGTQLVAALISQDATAAAELWRQANADRLQGDVLMVVLRGLTSMLDPTIPLQGR